MALNLLLSAFAGLVTMFVTNGILAAVVIGPLLEHRYQDIVADPVNFPLLVAGYLIIALALAALYASVSSTRGWLGRGLALGVPVGLAIFLGAHTVIAAYTTVDTMGFVLSGLLDSLGPLVGTLTIAFVQARLQPGAYPASTR